MGVVIREEVGGVCNGGIGIGKLEDTVVIDISGVCVWEGEGGRERGGRGS